MASSTKLKAPFPYMGGKSAVAHTVWELLGDCGHYIEPFCGSCAVLLARNDFDPTRNTETVNDADGHIANVWRALKADPNAVAEWCSWPVNHADLIARKARMIREQDGLIERLCADDEYYHAKMAGYYIWAASCWIGSGMLCPNQRPHLGDKGMGVHAVGQRPHLSSKGKGVHAVGQRPHLGDKGVGVHAVGKIPHLSSKGKGVHGQTPIHEWLKRLSDRLRHVRVVCGDWSRVCGGDWQDKAWSTVGMFFDPPYSDKANRMANCYAVDSLDVAHDVRAWCLERGTRPNYRIVLAGYYDEHADELLSAGWGVHKWKTQGGYANTATSEEETQGQANRSKEALFYSPACSMSQGTLFDVENLGD